MIDEKAGVGALALHRLRLLREAVRVAAVVVIPLADDRAGRFVQGHVAQMAEGHSRFGAYDARALDRLLVDVPLERRAVVALALRDDDQLALGMGLVAEAADRALGQSEAVARDHQAADRGRTLAVRPADLDHGDRRPAGRRRAWRSGYRVVEKASTREPGRAPQRVPVGCRLGAGGRLRVERRAEAERRLGREGGTAFVVFGGRRGRLRRAELAVRAAVRGVQERAAGVLERACARRRARSAGRARDRAGAARRRHRARTRRRRARRRTPRADAARRGRPRAGADPPEGVMRRLQPIPHRPRPPESPRRPARAARLWCPRAPGRGRARSSRPARVQRSRPGRADGGRRG